MPAKPRTELPARGRILAVDLGERRVGVAAAEISLGLALPLTTIDAGPDPAEAIVRLAEQEGARALVVGLPVSLSGALGPQAQRAQQVIDAITERLTIPVLTWDERLTSAEARRRRPAEGRRRRPRGDLDAAAAAIILQAFLDSRRRPAPA